MCRSIKTLRGQEPTTDEIAAAALQFVRKVSGYRKPSARNEQAFYGAVDDIAEITRRLLDSVTVITAAPVESTSPVSTRA